jgi:V/A-type H+-transporting ATPase subunit D
VAKIKFTKNELKNQRDALERYQRFLPTLQLKKQQLQAEVRTVRGELDDRKGELHKAKDDLSRWRALFSELDDPEQYLGAPDIEKAEVNVVGVVVPVIQAVRFKRVELDYFSEPMWLTAGLDMLERLVRLSLDIAALKERLELLEDELRVTTQRVNLFEKVKIPEARDNIRRIRIFMGDEQTAAVARAKIAKGKGVPMEGFA